MICGMSDDDIESKHMVYVWYMYGICMVYVYTSVPMNGIPACYCLSGRLIGILQGKRNCGCCVESGESPSSCFPTFTVSYD